MKVSVLVPAYNVEKYISQCLESICSQSYRDIEIVVINDGSQDSTFTVIKEFAAIDDRIKAISRPNKGVALTRNELLDNASGDFVLFVDADDWIEPDMISTLACLAEEFSVSLAMCDNFRGQSTDNFREERIRVWDKETFLNKFMEHRELTGSLWNKLIKKDLFNGLRFRADIGYGEDALIVWDILSRLNKMVYINLALYHYRVNTTGITGQRLSESKMSVMQVWDYISGSELAAKYKLTNRAKARFAAEIILLLLDAGNDRNDQIVRTRINTLRKKLKELYRYVITDNILSYKFKVFASLAVLNRPLLNVVCRRFGYRTGL